MIPAAILSFELFALLVFGFGADLARRPAQLLHYYSRSIIIFPIMATMAVLNPRLPRKKQRKSNTREVKLDLDSGSEE